MTERLHAWLAALHNIWNTILRVDRSQLTVATAIRSTIGTVVPLAIAVATGHPLDGITLTAGSSIIGGFGLNFTYHARVRSMFLSSLGIGISALVGGFTGDIDGLGILIAGIWGFGAGLLVSVSQAASFIGLQAALVLIIFSHFVLSPAQTLHYAALVFLGALIQTGLALIPVPWLSFGVERGAMLTVYQTLADYAENDAPVDMGRPISEAFVKAETTLADSNPRSPKSDILYGLLEEAERIRLDLLVLSNIRQTLTEDHTEEAECIKLLKQIKESTVPILRDIATTLNFLRPPADLNRPYRQFEAAINGLQNLEMPDHEGVQDELLAYSEILYNRLRLAEELARSWSHVGTVPCACPRKQAPRSTPYKMLLSLHNPLATLRANLTLHSTAFRHAIRMGIVLAIATAIYHLLPSQRGYWIALTAVIVLKPDFTSTFTRGAARIAGTLLGVALTSLLVSILPTTPVTLLILLAIASFLAYTFMNANYTIFSALITAQAITLLTFVDPHPLLNLGERALNTLIGGALALTAYIAWPTWEHPRMFSTLANRLQALHHYFDAVMIAYIQLDNKDMTTIKQTRHEARLARSNAAVSVERALSEPAKYRLDPNFVRGLMACLDAFAQSILSLEGHLQSHIPYQHQPLPELADCVTATDTVLQATEDMLSSDQMRAALPRLQESLHTLKRLLRSVKQQGDADAGDLIVRAEEERIVSALTAVGQFLTTKYGRAGGQS